MEQTDKPLLGAAFLCERVLHERDGVLSAIRLVDTFTVQRPMSDLPTTVVPTIQCVALIMFKSGEARGRYEVTLRLRPPSAEPREIGRHTIELKGDHQGASLTIELRIAVREFGLFWIDVLLDGGRVTSMPLRLRRREAVEQLPPSSS